MTRYSKHARLLAGALALVVGLTLVAPAGLRGEPGARPAPDRHRRDRQGRGAARGHPGPGRPAAPPAPAAVAGTGDKPFFKTTKGAIALVLLAGGLGYTAYSMSNDRVKSPAK